MVTNPAPCKIYMQRVRLNRGGYTSTGEYFGIGKPLYAWQADFENIYDYESGELRAHDRDDAKAQLLERFPNARFAR